MTTLVTGGRGFIGSRLVEQLLADGGKVISYNRDFTVDDRAGLTAVQGELFDIPRLSETLSRYGVDTILMPPSAPLTGALKESSKWHLVYDDGVALIFRADRAVGRQESVAGMSGGEGRDREVTKTQASDHAITEKNNKT